jgi:dATP pyrophosphohydrolase
MPKIPRSVLVVIHSPEKDVLLIERADQAGYWQSVTGSLDALDEPPMTAAIREVHEETGIDILAAPDRYVFTDWQRTHQYEIFPQWRWKYGEGVTHNIEHVFGLCIPRDTPITLAPREHVTYQWLPALHAAPLCFSPSNAEMILRISS